MKTYSKDFLIISRSVGSIIAIPFGFFAIADVISTIQNAEGHFMQNMNYEGLIMTSVILLFLTGYVATWIHTGIGGVLIILSGLLVAFPLIIIDGNIGTLIFAIPFTGSGLLYVVYWHSKRQLKRTVNN